MLLVVVMIFTSPPSHLTNCLVNYWMSRSQTGMPQNRKVDKPPRMNRFPKCRKVVDGGAGREQPFAANGCKELAKPATMGCASAVLLGVLWVLRFFREVERYSRLINEATYPAPNPLS